MVKNLKKRTHTQFAVYVPDTHVTLKQGQGHQMLKENVDPEQGYSRTKCRRSRFNGVREKANVISLEYERTSKTGIFMI